MSLGVRGRPTKETAANRSHSQRWRGWGWGSDLTGIGGSYGIHLDAAQRAAAELGLAHAREAQSIPWEAVRLLFSPEFKTPANKAAIEDIWKNVDSGVRSVDDARRAIRDLAGGFDEPSWNGSGPRYTPDEIRSYHEIGMVGDGVPGRGAGPLDGGARGGTPAGPPLGRIGNPTALAQEGAPGTLKAAVSIPENEAPVVHLFTGVSDFSSLVHESFHVWRRFLDDADLVGKSYSVEAEEAFSRAGEPASRPHCTTDLTFGSPKASPSLGRIWILGSICNRRLQPQLPGARKESSPSS